MTLPAVPACGPPYSSNSGISGAYSYNAATGDLTISGNNIATMANGTYCFRNLTVTNSAQLRVNGPVVIKLTGAFNVSGAASVNNTTGIPGNLRLSSSYSGALGVNIVTSNNVFMMVYTPRTGATISGAGTVLGSIAARTIVIVNSGKVHYDTTLESVWPAFWSAVLAP